MANVCAMSLCNVHTPHAVSLAEDVLCRGLEDCELIRDAVVVPEIVFANRVPAVK